MIGSVGGGPGIGRAGWIEMVIVVEERGFAAVVAAAAAETEIETAETRTTREGETTAVAIETRDTMAEGVTVAAIK